ncbi:MAG: acyl-CoA synthetase, partial [bacterium]
MRRPLVAIIGAGDAAPDSPEYMLAQACGAAVIDAGARVVCGGLGGIMEAAARGAHESVHYVEGSTIGILPGDDPAAANAWVDVPIATGLGRARNFIVA